MRAGTTIEERLRYIVAGHKTQKCYFLSTVGIAIKKSTPFQTRKSGAWNLIAHILSSSTNSRRHCQEMHNLIQFHLSTPHPEDERRFQNAIDMVPPPLINTVHHRNIQQTHCASSFSISLASALTAPPPPPPPSLPRCGWCGF